MQEAEKTFKWGILGSGNIAGKLVKSSWSVPACEVVAVASRTPGKAADFAGKYEIKSAYSRYQELVADPAIDIVYVANTHNDHEESVLLALEAGKHVLCEKPLAVNTRQVDNMISAAHAHKRFLMEAMWTRFLPAIGKVRSWVAAGKIGNIKQIHASFGLDLLHVPRLTYPQLAGGALLDLGIYPISFASMLCGGRAPISMQSVVDKLQTGVDAAANMLFQYQGGEWADLKCSCAYALPTEAWVIGDRGLIHIPADFYASQKAVLTIDGEETVASFPAEKQQSLKHQIQEVQACIGKGLLESPLMPLNETLEIVSTMDALRREWGIEYPFE